MFLKKLQGYRAEDLTSSSGRCSTNFCKDLQFKKLRANRVTHISTALPLLPPTIIILGEAIKRLLYTN